MRIAEIISRIEKVANPASAASWDRSGLQVACRRLEADKMAVMLDPLPDQLKKALDWGARFILSHHPLALKPELPSELDNYYYALKYLLCEDAALYAAHTSLDVNLKGPAGWLGRALNLRYTGALEPVCEGLGYGMVGMTPLPVSFEQLLDGLCELLDMKEIVVANRPDENTLISRLAICGGSGASLIKEAEKLGAQAYITGDIKYHSALDSWIALIDVGHHSIEERMMALFAEALSAESPDLEIKFFPSKSPFATFRPGS